MACVSPRIVGDDFDRQVADRHRAQQVGSEPREMRQPELACCFFDGPAYEGDRWTGVLMVGMPRECLQQRTDLPLARAPLRRSGSQICAVPHARPLRPAVRCSPIQGSAPDAGGTPEGILLFPILCTSERAYGRKNWPATRTVLARDQRHSGRRRLCRRTGTSRQALSCARRGAGTAARRVHDAYYLQVRLQAPSGPARRPAPRERARRDCPRRPQRGKPEKARTARDRLR
jgi:hypothetical protein